MSLQNQITEISGKIGIIGALIPFALIFFLGRKFWFMYKTRKGRKR